MYFQQILWFYCQRLLFVAPTFFPLVVFVLSLRPHQTTARLIYHLNEIACAFTHAHSDLHRHTHFMKTIIFLLCRLVFHSQPPFLFFSVLFCLDIFRPLDVSLSNSFPGIYVFCYKLPVYTFNVLIQRSWGLFISFLISTCLLCSYSYKYFWWRLHQHNFTLLFLLVYICLWVFIFLLLFLVLYF